jgi:hypothetical protein
MTVKAKWLNGPQRDGAVFAEDTLAIGVSLNLFQRAVVGTHEFRVKVVLRLSNLVRSQTNYHSTIQNVYRSAFSQPLRLHPSDEWRLPRLERPTHFLKERRPLLRG